MTISDKPIAWLNTRSARPASLAPIACATSAVAPPLIMLVSAIDIRVTLAEIVTAAWAGAPRLPTQ